MKCKKCYFHDHHCEKLVIMIIIVRNIIMIDDCLCPYNNNPSTFLSWNNHHPEFYLENNHHLNDNHYLDFYLDDNFILKTTTILMTITILIFILMIIFKWHSPDIGGLALPRHRLSPDLWHQIRSNIFFPKGTLSQNKLSILLIVA